MFFEMLASLLFSKLKYHYMVHKLNSVEWAYVVEFDLIQKALIPPAQVGLQYKLAAFDNYAVNLTTYIAAQRWSFNTGGH